MQKKVVNKLKNGFTLTELIIVIAIIGILTAIIVPTTIGFVEKARLSNDTSLVRNINMCLKGQEILVGSPNDIIELQAILEEEYGLSLVTQSKGNYLWYDVANQNVVLGSIKNDRLNISLDANSVKAAEGEADLSILDSIMIPEKFVDGYWFIGTGSRDGFAQAICNVRNNGALTKSDSEVLEKISPKLSSLEQDLLQNAAIITNDTDAAKTETSEPKIILCGRNVTKIENQLNNINMSNINVFDLPSQISTVSSSILEQVVVNNIVIVCATETLRDTLIAINVEVTVILSIDRAVNIGRVYYNMEKYDSTQTDQNHSGSKYIEVYLTDIVYVKLPVRSYKSSTSSSHAYVFQGWLNQFGVEIDSDYNNLENFTKPLELNNTDFIITNVDNMTVGCYDIIAHFKLDTENLGTAFFQSNEYYTVADAISLASLNSTSDTIKITAGTSAKLDRNVTVSNNDTILITYSDAYSAGLKDMEKTTAALGTPYTTLVINEDVKLTVDGILNVNAKRGGSNGSANTGYTCGNYGYLYLEQNSQIIMANGSFLYCNGYISGPGLVEAAGGSTVYEVFAVRDWIGGSAATAAKNQKVFPFQQYTISNIESDLKVHYESKVYARTAIFVTILWMHTDIMLTDESSNSLFQLNSGYYIKKYDSTNGRTYLELYGEMNCNNITMNFGMSISASDFEAFPITGNFSISIEENSKFVQSANIKMMPGSEILIKENAVYEILDSYKLYVYGENTYHQNYNKISGTGRGYPNISTVYTRLGANKDVGYTAQSKATLTVLGTITGAGQIIGNGTNLPQEMVYSGTISEVAKTSGTSSQCNVILRYDSEDGTFSLYAIKFLADIANPVAMPVRSGYTFAGVYDNPEFSGSPLSATISFTGTKNTTVYIKWDKIS